jgi:hypothetical protein
VGVVGEDTVVLYDDDGLLDDDDDKGQYDDGLVEVMLRHSYRISVTAWLLDH